MQNFLIKENDELKLKLEKQAFEQIKTLKDSGDDLTAMLTVII
jgi:hypothetical protein